MDLWVYKLLWVRRKIGKWNRYNTYKGNTIMSIKSKTCRMIPGTLAAMLLILGPSVAKAVSVDITTLPGYGVATSAAFNFNGSGGWAGWSVPAGKVVLGAEIISTGDTFSDFAVFRPAGPEEVFAHYTYGANEYGWVLQDNGLGANNGVQMEVYYADPLAGYTITESAQLSYSATGWGGWSAPSGDVVSGGGYQFATTGAYPASSQIALEDSEWPHYNYGPNEQGWVVQSGAVGGSSRLYVVSFDAPASVPDGGATLALMAFALTGLGSLRRKFSV